MQVVQVKLATLDVTFYISETCKTETLITVED